MVTIVGSHCLRLSRPDRHFRKLSDQLIVRRGSVDLDPVFVQVSKYIFTLQKKSVKYIFTLPKKSVKYISTLQKKSMKYISTLQNKSMKYIFTLQKNEPRLATRFEPESFVSYASCDDNGTQSRLKVLSTRCYIGPGL
jgi:hypothetical protein